MKNFFSSSGRILCLLLFAMTSFLSMQAQSESKQKDTVFASTEKAMPADAVQAIRSENLQSVHKVLSEAYFEERANQILLAQYMPADYNPTVSIPASAFLSNRQRGLWRNSGQLNIIVQNTVGNRLMSHYQRPLMLPITVARSNP